MTWVANIKYDPLNPNGTRDISTIDGMRLFITKDFHFSTSVKYDKVKIYKPGYKIYEPTGNSYEGHNVDLQHNIVNYRNMENQVVGPFPLETNTIEIIVAYSDTDLHN